MFKEKRRINRIQVESHRHSVYKLYLPRSDRGRRRRAIRAALSASVTFFLGSFEVRALECLFEVFGREGGIGSGANTLGTRRLRGA